MIKKQQCLGLLNNILDTEEEGAEHYYKYAIDSLKYYTWLNEGKRKEISEITTQLRQDCKRHKSMIGELIKHVQESEKKCSKEKFFLYISTGLSI